MNPKNTDRMGKGLLVVVGTAIIVAAKKYGPVIIKNTGRILKIIISKKQQLYRSLLHILGTF